MYYNVCGAASLGGKYESLKWFLYRVGSLLPGVVIGVDLVITRLRKVEQGKDDCRAYQMSSMME